MRKRATADSATSESVSRYMLPCEVECRLGISASTRRRWTNRGLLRAYPLGPHYRPGVGGSRNGSRVRYIEAEVNDLFHRIKRGEMAQSPKPQKTEESTP